MTKYAVCSGPVAGEGHEVTDLSCGAGGDEGCSGLEHGLMGRPDGKLFSAWFSESQNSQVSSGKKICF